MTRPTYGQALARIGVGVPDHLSAEAEVPMLTGVQAQGDLVIHPSPPPAGGPWTTVPDDGIRVIHGEATGNTHWLHRGFASPDTAWAPAVPDSADPLVLGHLRVPAGQSALLIHTDEHGANGIGPGTYTVRRKRQLDLGAAMDRLVED